MTLAKANESGGVMVVVIATVEATGTTRKMEEMSKD